MAVGDWYERHGCDHAHCPNGCEKPQPVEQPDGRPLCMRCLVYSGVEVECVPCTPEVCD